jgi:methylenetetrahydrofolate dehydrogenase (NADP+)/methenyltetrahydrofolate cyclohydrolase
MTVIFDGEQLAKHKARKLKAKVADYKTRGTALKVAAIFFKEDAASALYTSLKRQTAAELGIEYQAHAFSFTTPVSEIQAHINELNQDPIVTGIIIQKPWTRKWLEVVGEGGDFAAWWASLVSQIATKASHGVNKDVDGLAPATLEAIKRGTWMTEGMVLPATARAVLSILKDYRANVDPDFSYLTENVLIIGRSDLLGRPLYWHIKHLMERGATIPATFGQACQVAVQSAQAIGKKCEVKLVGKKELNDLIEQKKSLSDFRVIISATGHKNLITGDLIAAHSILIDVGEPQGDINLQSCLNKADFITPVPNGVGPMTVISLMANAVDLVKNIHLN